MDERQRPRPTGDAGYALRGDGAAAEPWERRLGSSPVYFEVRPTFWIVGLGVRGRFGLRFIHVPAGRERAWVYVQRGIAPRWAGMPIGRCFPTAEPVRRGGGGEEAPGGEPGD